MNLLKWLTVNPAGARVAFEALCFFLPPPPQEKVEPGPSCVSQVADGVMGGRRCPGVWCTDAGLIGAYQVFLQSKRNHLRLLCSIYPQMDLAGLLVALKKNINNKGSLLSAEFISPSGINLCCR